MSDHRSPHLALILPGSGYGPAGPVLLIPRLAAQQVGAQSTGVTYPEWRPGMDEDRARAFVEIVEAQLRNTIEELRPQRVTLLAKSLGCEVVARLDPSAFASVPRVDVVWLTPLFGLSAIREGAIAKAWPSLIVSGDADPSYDPAGTAAVAAATRGAALIVAKADHALEVVGDVRATVDGFRRLADAVLSFLR